MVARSRRYTDLEPLGEDDLEDIAVSDVLLCVLHHLAVLLLGQVGVHHCLALMMCFLGLAVVVPHDVCQLLCTPLCSSVLCAKVAVGVQVQDDDAVTGQMVVGDQLLIQEQVAVRHVNIILRHIGQTLFHIANGVIAKVADQSAGKVRCVRI